MNRHLLDRAANQWENYLYGESHKGSVERLLKKALDAGVSKKALVKEFRKREASVKRAVRRGYRGARIK